MRSTLARTVALLLFAAATSANADEILWDNYPVGLQDVTVNMSSERNTQVVESTWVVDDIALDPGMDLTGVAFTRLVWVGARDAAYSYSTADVIVLDADLNTVIELSDLEYLATPFDPEPNPDPGTQTYESEIVFDEPISLLDSGLGPHLYVGVRLVGDGYLQGRNHAVTSSIDSTLRGLTGGYTKAAVFGAPTWRPASDVWYGGPSGDSSFEFAFRMYAVPEPASVGLLLVGGLLLVWRR
jgi:hypothetical protein